MLNEKSINDKLETPYLRDTVCHPHNDSPESLFFESDSVLFYWNLVECDKKTPDSHFMHCNSAISHKVGVG